MKYENVNIKNFQTLYHTAKSTPTEAFDTNRPVWIFGAGILEGVSLCSPGH